MQTNGTLRLFLGIALALCLAGTAHAQAKIEDFVGTYVGTARVLGSDGSVEEERDVDITIATTKDGFTVDWINVSLVDGRRDVPGVKRRAQSLAFRDEGDGRFVVERRRSLFERRSEGDMFAGAPVSWARLDGNKLGVFTLVVLENGAYSLQVYERILTDQGIDIEFVRLDEGVPSRTIEGHTIRVE
ncbi:MAG: hypothetical protein AAFW76_04485 [Pseudomonadota bacterium]